jgi:Zn-dependent protease with chaperone function
MWTSDFKLMLEFSGTYFDGRSSRAYAVRVCFEGGELILRGETLELRVPFTDCVIAPPLGKTNRTIQLSRGAVLETEDFAAIQELEERTGRNQGMRLVDRLERQWKFVLVSIVVLCASLWVFVQFGVPFAADQLAFVTPAAVLGQVGAQTMQVLDNTALEASMLEAQRKREIMNGFETLVKDIGAGHTYQLEFRDGGSIGPNAFALPNGTIVITDQLIELAENDREILGVLAHEMGHVTGRHGLRGLYRGAGVMLLISIAAGDIASVTSLASSLPALLVQTGYTRDFEREADQVSGQYMLRVWGSTKPLQDILARLSKDHTDDENDLTGMLASHPGTKERIRSLKILERKP